MSPDPDVVRAVKTEREAIAKFIESLVAANPNSTWKVANALLVTIARRIRKGGHHDE